MYAISHLGLIAVLLREGGVRQVRGGGGEVGARRWWRGAVVRGDGERQAGERQAEAVGERRWEAVGGVVLGERQVGERQVSGG